MYIVCFGVPTIVGHPGSTPNIFGTPKSRDVWSIRFRCDFTPWAYQSHTPNSSLFEDVFCSKFQGHLAHLDSVSRNSGSGWNIPGTAIIYHVAWRLGAILTTWYPLVISHSYGKSRSFMGKSTISMAIFNSKLLVYQRVDFQWKGSEECGSPTGCLPVERLAQSYLFRLKAAI